VGADQTVVSYANGGGGFGDPRTREPDRVAFDVREKWISAERARDVYGVALDADGGVDAAATARLRGAA
jgi:N-methylhydantoinase B